LRQGKEGDTDHREMVGAEIHSMGVSRDFHTWKSLLWEVLGVERKEEGPD